MNAYEVTYKGLWMGGSAIVIADSGERAIELVRADASTVCFEDVQARLITGNLVAPSVLHNDNGNY